MEIVKRRNPKGTWTHRHDGMVVYRHQKGLTTQQIADDMGWSVQQIKDATKRLGLTPNRLPTEERAKISAQNASRKERGVPRREQIPVPLDGGIVLQARRILSERFSDSRGFWMLDGTPCSLDRLMQEANRVLKRRNMEQLGRKPEWLV